MTQPAEPNPAVLYADFLAPAVFEPWAEELLRHAGPTAGERVLDVGCGTGVVTRAAAARVGPRGAVTGLDFNPAMLEVARQTPAPDGAAPISYVVGAADDIAYPDANFDLVTCQQMLQFAPDRAAVVRQFRRVLAPGGRTAIAVCADITHNADQQPLDDAIVRRVGPPGIAAGLSFGSPDDLAALLDDAGFNVQSLDLVAKEARFPDPELVIRRWLLAATAGIPGLRQLDGAARQSDRLDFRRT
jgi:2-polyprenyl-3-methyl-5-hydroxy-6-metoxy-1,4-benzoquinol methylase